MEEFIQILSSINRKNTTELLTALKSRGFFESPASANYHLNTLGGLVQHSLAVYKCALALRDTINNVDNSWKGLKELNEESIAIASLLHDVCKAGIYVQAVKRKKVDNVWIDAIGYDLDYSSLPLGHGEKSLAIILSCGYPLTDDEMLAIRWHMSAYKLNQNDFEEYSNYKEATKVPLVRLIQLADQMATMIDK